MKYHERQGDLLFTIVDAPKGKKKAISPILAYGEATGHTHAIRTVETPMSDMESMVDENGDIYVKNMHGPVVIDHQEHGTLTFPQDKWICCTRQREYDPASEIRERQVRD